MSLNKTYFVFGAFMTVLYSCLGCVFLFTNYLNDLLSGQNRTIFAWVLIVYAGFKGFMLYQKVKAPQYDKE